MTSAIIEFFDEQEAVIKAYKIKTEQYTTGKPVIVREILLKYAELTGLDFKQYLKDEEK